MTEATQTPLLEARNLKMHFPIRKGILFQKTVSTVQAVDGVQLTLYKGETLGLVGESGCGKSTLGRCLVRLYDPTDGSILLEGKDISRLPESQLRPFRSQFQIIFQDPYASLNPRMTVFDIIAEPLITHKRVDKVAGLSQQVAQLMELVGLSPRYVRKYPHEFSGGQRQRIAIARALALNPKVIICDEPVSALDVSIQAQILNLLNQLKSELGLSYIFIAHDMAAVRHISDRISVMYLGKIVESAPRDELFNNPKHPYTKALLSAVPLPDPHKERARKRILLKGDLPSPMNPPLGCRFHTRCPYAMATCQQKTPKWLESDRGHGVACHLVNEASIEERESTHD